MKRKNSAWLAPGSLVAIIAFAVGPLIVVPALGLEGSLDRAQGAMLLATLAIVALANLFTARFLVLPGNVAHGEQTQESVMSLGYAFATTPAIFGMVASLFTGRALIALPFGAFALLFWFVIRQFLKESYPEDRGSRMRDHRR